MSDNKHLLIVHHSQSGTTSQMAQAVIRGARSPEIGNVEVRTRTALEATAADLLWCDAFILGTPENFGYMSGALKDFFDRCYYPLLDRTDALPYALLVRAGQDGTGTCRAVASITTGLRWKPVQDPTVCRGQWDDGFVDQAKELGTAMAAGLEMGVF